MNLNSIETSYNLKFILRLNQLNGCFMFSVRRMIWPLWVVLCAYLNDDQITSLERIQASCLVCQRSNWIILRAGLMLMEKIISSICVISEVWVLPMHSTFLLLPLMSFNQTATPERSQNLPITHGFFHPSFLLQSGLLLEVSVFAAIWINNKDCPSLFLGHV